MSLFAKRGLGESHSGFLQLSLAIIPETKRLETKFQRQLNLPRIVYSPRCPIVLIRRTFGETGGRRRTTTCTRTKWAEICGAINRIEGPNVPSFGRRYRRIEHDPVPDVVRRQRALRAEILAVLWNQHEAGIRAIVDGLRPCVADAVGKVMCKPLVHVD